MKKILSLIRFVVIGFIWSYVFVFLTHFLMLKLWSFNLFSVRSWQIINRFWEAGGVIKTARDYAFLTMLTSLPIVWILGWRFFLNQNYLNILLAPINAYNNHIIKKYGSESKRIVLRNIKSSQKMIEEVKEQIDAIKPAKNQEASIIRTEVIKTISQMNKKE